MRTGVYLLGVLLLGALLASCASSPAGAVSPTATRAPTATPTATITTSPVTSTPFTCPVTVSGAVKVFSDSESGLTFDYPAAWTENDCERIVAQNSGGAVAGQSLVIGNLFIVAVAPRRGLTIQQFVSNVQGSDETVTLTPLTVAHAVAAVRVSATPSADATQPPRFAQTLAIIAGTQNFYEVTGLVAQMSMTDTMPDQPATSLLASFDVP